MSTVPCSWKPEHLVFLGRMKQSRFSEPFLRHYRLPSPSIFTCSPLLHFLRQGLKSHLHWGFKIQKAYRVQWYLSRGWKSILWVMKVKWIFDGKKKLTKTVRMNPRIISSTYFLLCIFCNLSFLLMFYCYVYKSALNTISPNIYLPFW